jgi:hypothetical protein
MSLLELLTEENPSEEAVRKAEEKAFEERYS